MIEINYDRLTQIKKIDLPGYLLSKGINLKHSGNSSWAGLCPFHKDKNPSLSVSFKKNKWIWHCFGCHKSGNIIDFIQALENKSFLEVYVDLGRVVDAGNQTKTSDILEDITKIYHNNLKESKPAQDYLKERGLLDKELIDTFRIGYSNGALLKLIPDDEATKQRLKELGVLNENYNESYYKSITVPIFDENNLVVGLYGRNIERKAHHYLKNPHRGVFNYKAAKVYDSIIITEAIIDALTLYKNGFKNVISSYGTNGFCDIHLNLLRENNIKEAYLCYDNDESGDRASNETARLLTNCGITTKRVKLSEGIKDINQYFDYTKALDFKGTKETFSYLLDKAARIGYTLAQVSKTKGLISKKDFDFKFLYEEIEYNVHLIDIEEASSLKVVITARKEVIRSTDKFDLYSQKQRKVFENIISKKFNLPQAEIEAHILDIITELETQREDIANTPKKPTHTMTDQDKEKALLYLKDPLLLENITKDIERAGYIGEDSNKLIAYLTASSRKLRKPLSAIIVSQSATGKSFLMEKIASLIPDEEVEFYSRITPQSLYYMEKDQLKNKLLIVDERSGSEEADYAIRSLQTRHKLSLAYPLKDPTDGKLKTIVVEMEGPIAFMESSTKARLNIENTTRSFMLYLDESQTQTEDIHKHQRYIRTLEGKRKQKEIPDIINLHKNIQRLLKPLDVIIDFKNLTFPSTWIRTRRDQERFLSLIEVITFLYQYQRKTEKDSSSDTEYIKATPADYKIAYNLTKQAFLDTLSDLPKPSMVFLNIVTEAVSKRAIEKAKETQDFTFRRRDIREWLKLPDHVVKRHMKLLEELEYVNIKRDSKNGYITYTLSAGNLKPSYLEALTKPKDIN